MPQNVGCCSGSTASTEDLQHPLKSAAALGASPQRGYVPVQAGPQRFQSRVGDGPRGPAPSGTAATRTVQLAYNARLVCQDSGFYCTPRDSARFGVFGASRFARFAIRTTLKTPSIFHLFPTKSACFPDPLSVSPQWPTSKFRVRQCNVNVTSKFRVCQCNVMKRAAAIRIRNHMSPPV